MKQHAPIFGQLVDLTNTYFFGERYYSYVLSHVPIINKLMVFLLGCCCLQSFARQTNAQYLFVFSFLRVLRPCICWWNTMFFILHVLVNINFHASCLFTFIIFALSCIKTGFFTQILLITKAFQGCCFNMERCSPASFLIVTTKTTF